MKVRKMEKNLRYAAMCGCLCFGGNLAVLLFIFLLFFTENEEES